MSCAKLEIEKAIKDRVKKLKSFKQSRGIRLSSHIVWSIVEDSIVEMKLSVDAICSNMQEDKGAFEGWALIIKRWSEYDKVMISWDNNAIDINNKHYQRFLFRLKNFSQDFTSWFFIDRNCQKLLDTHLKIKETEEYIMNYPSMRKDRKPVNQEAILENCFVNGNLKKALMNVSNADVLYKQLPVGVFKGMISKDSSIFTNGKSAIDIWGINELRESLLVFELKVEGNKKIGIISELYFYVCVLQMIQKQKFKYEDIHDKYEYLLDISKTEKIEAYFLSATLHVLIDSEIIELLNKSKSNEVIYGYINYDKNYNLKLLNTF